MRPGVPWSVKGIEPEAREAAKQAARRAGMTLGAWLNQMILDTGPGKEGEQPASFADQAAADAAVRPVLPPPLASIDLGPVTDAVRDLVQRSDDSERRTMDMVHRLDQTIEQMAGRLAQAEQTSPAVDIQAAVEAGLSTLSDRLDLLAHRLDITEQNQTDRAQAGPDVMTVNAALKTSLAELGERLDATELSMATIASGLEKTQTDAIELALKAFSEKAVSEHRQTTIEGIEKNLDEMNDRLDKVANRSTDAIKTIEASLITVAARLEEIGALDRFVEPGRLETLEAKLDELTRQTDQLDARTASAGEAIDHALANFSTERASTDARFEKLDTLHDTMKQMAQRITDLEVDLPPASPPSPLLEESPAIDDFSDTAEADQTAFQTVAFQESEEVAAQASSMTWLDDTLADNALDADAGDTGAGIGEPDQDDQEAETAASKLDDYLTTARRAAQGASDGSAALGGSVLAGMPSRIAAYEEEKKRQRTKIVTGTALVLLALVSALAMFRWSELEPELNAPAIVAPHLNPLDGGMSSVSPRDGNVLGPVEERIFNRDAALSDTTRDLADQNIELADPSPTDEPAGQPALEPTLGDLVSGDAGGGRVALLPRPEALPPVDAAPSTPVVTSPIEGAKPSLASVAESGNAAAQYETGLLYARGSTVAQDYEAAVVWFKKSADQGFASAQYRLATLYEKGRGVPEDAAAARDFYEQAAAQGNVKSMHNLAVIYAEGKGTDQDFSRAAHWFGQAAEFGLGDSQYNLAILNERGLGLPKDLSEAHKWFSIAAENGDAGAATRRNNVASQLDAEALVNAKLAARTWAPRQANPIANGDIASLRTWAEVSPSTPADIARAQALLTALGHDPGPADGLMGTRTREAIRAFQASAGLAETGEVTPELVDKLEAVTR